MGIRLNGFFILMIYLSLINSSALSKNLHWEGQALQWADSMVSTLTIDQKIGQLIMVAAYSKKNENHFKNIEYLLKNYHIGGLIFFQGSPSQQVKLIKRYQRITKIPLWIGMDAEWGAGMRLDSLLALPKNMTLGAVEDNRLIYNTGAEVARQLKLLGVHMNFAPVLDVNNNPENPVINVRSFGEDPVSVSHKGISYMKGLQENGIMAVGKHFPGHGDTRNDSHYMLPVIQHNKQRLDSVEMYPFIGAIENGIDGIMVGHLNIPALDPENKWPATLSGKIINGTLRQKLGFSGLVFSDAMNMRGVTSNFSSGKAELQAFKAGCDVIVMPVNIPKVFAEFKKALHNKEISEERIDQSVTRILAKKYEILSQERPEPARSDLKVELNKNTNALSGDIFENAVTIVNNNAGLLPFHFIDTIRFASLAVYGKPGNAFQLMLDQYAKFDHYTLQRKNEPEDLQHLMDEIEGYDVIIVSLHDLSSSARKDYGLDSNEMLFLDLLNEKAHVVLVGFGIPYSLRSLSHFDHVVCAYEDNEIAYKTVPQILFGALPSKGTLPVSINDQFKEGTGHFTPAIGRLGFSDPNREGFNETYLKLIDTIIDRSIQDKAFPGCQVLIARNGRIVLNKSYGYLTYDSLREITSGSLYDLASVTKIAGTVQALMIMYDRGLIDLDKKASYYLPELKNTNKENLIIRDILTHQSGLFPYYPYWRNTLKSHNRGIKYFSKEENEEFGVEVIDKLFTTSALKDTLWNWMIKSNLREKEDKNKPYDYKYSDIGFYIIQQLVEDITGMSLDLFLNTYLFEPLGLQHLSFLPKERFDLKYIVPTEIDRSFRKGLVWGNVHDEIASLYGGVAGHAGLFSSASDLAKIMQMNLQGGYYGGIQYFHPPTVQEFTRRQYKVNRRGLGWDKPEHTGDEYNPSSFFASERSYGHSGFTGTFTWVDPEYDLIYIFLSNRTYPDSDNRKLIDQDIRKRIQTVIYSSIINH